MEGMITHDDFRAFTQGRCGVIELNRSKALNSLTVDMIRGIDQALDLFEQDSSVDVIVIASSTERAFCAGGDVRWVRERDLDGDFEAGNTFFEEEYRLNSRMASFPKPLVALLNGVVMGGGFGISAHGSHRLVTSTTLGAMPEAAIGFVPDVGMSHVLTHLPVGKEIGEFIGLTGWRLSPADMLWTGLGTHLVENPASIVEELREDDIEQVLQRRTLPVEEAGESQLASHADFIREALSHDSWVDVEAALRDGVSNTELSEEFRSALKDQLDSANPTSQVAGFEMFERAAAVDVDTALRNELTVGTALRHQPNFAEGVRAVLVDKDRTATFDPAESSAVDAAAWRELLD
ncbi:enoyl-CoA hydratase/isomerase family protein [Corynebacterium sp. 320]|nr:enoyl-CoA hydratase/isomerase family protein [Corynebacterium sp. 320]KAB1552822.1 enoyl-CoA hydratase/isomerase family protein [Corynebacterium sp. 321]KAB1553960.1 enoyl-CoA hydratase/isomerase family protein [Corynebacterium sp. 319]KAB3528216.1 enoyl-CoA hydratase/isomerase family protein [Corynebacterium sp. 250]KAB3540297.1 enoyl-CoA hydratase/isomerase family protein [Corynebacterium sp. 366]